MYGDRLKQNGVHLTNHEWATVRLLLDADSKRTVELIPPMGGDKVHTPDIETDSIIWEIKAPEGGGKNTIRHNLERAKKQSRNIIIDLRWCRLREESAIKELEQRFQLSKRFRRMRIITKNKEILDFSK